MRNRLSTRPSTAMSGREVHELICGWDWGSTIHGVCLLDDDGATIKTWMVNHTDTELAALFAELANWAEPAPVPGRDRKG